MSTRTKLVSLMPALAIAAMGAAPSANAATPAITAATAGTKALGLTTYMWGTANVAPGSKICSQVALNSGWSTSQCSTVSATHSYTIELTYGKTTRGTYTFRATSNGINSPSVTLTRGSGATPTKPAPTKPAPAQPVVYDHGVLGNSYTLYSGYNGVKVYLAQKALGMNPGPVDTTLGPFTTKKLKDFQSSRHLPVTGVLDQNTWNALAPRDPNTGALYPFNIDSWTKTSDVMNNAPRDVRVAAMISFARAQIGKPYIWGGTGPIGFDCSGLLLQAARAGGMKPANVSNFTDIRQQSDLSNQMLHDGEFQAGSLYNLHVGDFVYYGNAYGHSGHIAMYIGNNTVINATTDLNSAGQVVSGDVRYSSLSNNDGWKMKIGVNRAFAL